MSTMYGIPWSAEAESRLRRRIRICHAGMWLFVGGWLTCLVARSWAWSILCVILAILCFLRTSTLVEELGRPAQRTPHGFSSGSGMLANKPVSTLQLTIWIEHPGSDLRNRSFQCECGLRYFWSDAKWFPMYSEETRAFVNEDEIQNVNAGRLVKLCLCGRGHFIRWNLGESVEEIMR